MKEELTQILNELEEVLKDKYKLTDFEKVDLAIKLYITESIGKQKQFYPKNEFRNDFKKEELSKTSPLTSKDELPTEKQLYAIKKANIQIPAGLTRREASTIIKRIKG